MNTAGWITQGKPNPDAEIFISALGAFVAAGAGIVASALGTSNLIGTKIPASITGSIEIPISALLLRTGILQSTNFATNQSQEAFGTANGPGPSSVSGTSGPSGFSPDAVIPPITAANLATLKGSTAGAPKKGIQINWLDFIYQVGTLAATAVQGQLSKLSVPSGADVSPTLVNLSSLTTLSAVVNSTTAKVHRQRVTVTTPAMIVDDAATLLVTFNAVTPATSTVTLAGVVLGCSYNFN